MPLIELKILGVKMIICADVKEQVNSQKQCFVRMWQENHNGVRRFCMRRLSGQEDLVDDVMSQTAEKAYLYLKAGNTYVENPFAWLCTMSRNICSDIFRAETKSKALCDEVYASSDHYYFTGGQSEPLELTLEREADVELLQHEIAKLPNELKELLILRCIEGWEYRDIANMTDLSVVNLRKRVQLVRSRLRDVIAQ